MKWWRNWIENIDDDFDPLDEPVKQRSYTQTTQTVKISEEPIPEPQVKSQQAFATREPDKNLGSSGGSGNSTGGDKGAEKQKNNVNEKLDDLSPSQKKRLRVFKAPVPVREISIVTHREFLKASLIQSLKDTILSVIPIEMKHNKRINILEI